MVREHPAGLRLMVLAMVWGWGLGCAPAGEPDSGVAPPAETAVLPEAELSNRWRSSVPMTIPKGW